VEKTKLTIRVARELPEEAKRYAEENNTTLTRLVSEYLRRLTIQNDSLAEAPVVRRLSGILSPDASVEEYQKYLASKHGEQD
jgi:hypothetical protein